ncbi:MAG: TetR/AcrR family transcriptional regulator [Acidobacteriota bacterium]
MVTKGEETRRIILDCAMAMTSTLGLEGLTIGSVAREVEMSKSGLFAHFESKQDLQLQVLAAAVDRFTGMVIAPALRQPRGEPRIRALVENWLAWEEWMPGGCVFIAAANELDDRPGELRDRLVSAQRDWLDSLAHAARIAVREGHFAADLDCEQFAYQLYSIILAYHHFHRLLRDPGARERARTAFTSLVEQSRSADTARTLSFREASP